ncbi:MAG: hypothetical protein ACOYOL_01675 [Chthoniobacterales bacterium]
MRYSLLALLLAVAPALAQEVVPVVPVTTAAPAKTAVKIPWGLTIDQYRLVDASRRPGGSTFTYQKARGRGPFGNLVEHVPGGPQRSVARRMQW